jgi:hypothetical protein
VLLLPVVAGPRGHGGLQVLAGKEEEVGGPTTVVVDLRTGREFHYVGLTPREAVVCAHALLGCQNGNSWEWQTRYGHLVEEGARCVFCGDFGAVKERDGT